MELSPTVLSIILLVVFVIMIVLLEWRRNRRLKMQEVTPVPFDELTAKYGDPDNIIIVNPTQGNRSDGVILVYEDMMVIRGEEILKMAITDVSFNNYGIVAYQANEYMIIIQTEIPGRDIIRIPVGTGNDAAFAKEIVQQIRFYLGK